jgi:hypothetical protein
MNLTEHQEQKAFFERIAYMHGEYPEVGLLFAIPNGGQRHPAVGRKMKAEGVKRGVPDIFLPVPSWGRYTNEGKVDWYHGLFIEMKRRKRGSLSKYQKEWIEKLREQGYRVEVCKGWEEAIEVLKDYLSS